MIAAGQQQQQQQKPANPPAPGKTHTGTVTKLLDNFGFIDDSIFFPLSAIKGANVKLGDKVYYECTYSKNLPFNWNATMVQLAPPNAPLGSSAHSGGGQPGPQQPPPSHQQYQMHQQQPPPQHQSGGYPPYQPPGGGNAPGGYNYNSHPQSKPMPPYQQPQQSQYQSSYGNSGPPPQQQQAGPQGPGQQQQQPSAGYSDLTQVQKAVAAAAQLSQYYTQQQGSGPPGSATGPPGSNAHSGLPGANQQHQGPGGGGPNGGPPPHGQPTGGGYGSIQYTSTPGAAFINAPQPYQPAKPPMAQGGGPPNRGPGGPMGAGPPGARWGAPGREEPYDPRRPPGSMGGGPPPGPPNSRFDSNGPPGRGLPGGPKSRFNDAGDRFGGPAIPIPPPPPPPQQQQQMNDDHHSRFGPPPQQQNEIYRQGGGASARDEFGRDIPKGDSRFGPRDGPPKDAYRATSRDKDSDSVSTNGNNDKDMRGGRVDRGRDRRRDNRDRGNRDRGNDKKRSISPASVTSSSGGTVRGDSGRKVPTGPAQRRYEGTNIPKNVILRNRYSAVDLKSKISSIIHIPSDLKEVLYNVDADLDLLDIPKPIVYKITNIEKEKEKEKDKEKETKTSDSKEKKAPDTPSKTTPKPTEKEKAKETEPKESKAESKAPAEGETVEIKDEEADKSVPDSSATSSQASVEPASQPLSESSESNVVPKEEPEQSETPTNSQESVVATQEVASGSSIEQKPAQQQEETEPKDMEIDEDSVNAETAASVIETNVPLEAVRAKPTVEAKHSEPAGLQHKFNVKVLLISLPTMSEINEQIFGADFDSSSITASKHRGVHFNKLFSTLVFRNSDSGYSLIGGKWIHEKDGTLPGKEDTPNLIATAIRVVHEQTGLNLTSCRQWNVFSTFVYNRDTHLDATSAVYEITKIYMPDIWSALETIYTPLGGTKEETAAKSNGETKSVESNNKPAVKVDTGITEAVSLQPAPEPMEQDGTTEPVIETENENDILSQIAEPEDKPSREYLESILEKLNEMKVAELRTELEQLNQKVDGRPRKDQLATRLRDYVHEQLQLMKQAEDGAEAKSETEAVKVEETETTKATEEATKVVEAKQNGLQGEEEEGKKDTTVLEATKRKSDEVVDKAEEEEQAPAKKPKTDEAPVEKTPEESASVSAIASEIKVKGQNLSTVRLSALLNPHKFDQFELCVVAELIRDSLTVHFARYILSAILHNQQSLKINNNSSHSITDKNRVVEANYVHLAFSYFDKGRCGHMPADDLNSLLNATGFPLSRKVFNSLTSACGGDRVVYRDFVPPPTLVDRQLVYPSVATSSSFSSTVTASDGADGPLIVERNGIQFNVDELIKRSETDQKAQVRLNEELLGSNNKIGQLEQTIIELETKQKKMSAATGRQNDELCAVKRERDQLKVKYEALRKTLEKAASTFSETLKQYQPASAVAASVSLADGTTTATQATESS